MTVKVLLRNEAYIGNMVQNKTGTVSYKDHSQISKPKERELEQQLDTTQAVQDDAQAWADLIRQYRTIDTLDREMLLRLIDKIEVGEKKNVNGQKEQEIRIHYKFVGYIQ